MPDFEINFKTAGEQVVIGALRNIGSGLLDIAGSALSGAVGAFGDLAQAAIDGNSAFERYETQFGVLLGSVDLAKDRLAELAKVGASTPFELPELVEGDKILQAFGLHAENVAERFGFSGDQIRLIAGDVAAGTGSSFQEMSTLIGKFASGATGEAISRFQEMGIVTREELAGMGLEFSKAGELLTPVDEAMDVVLAAMQDKFGGMMQAQSSTFEGMMSNFEDFKAGMIRTIGEPLFAVAKEGLGKLLEFLNGPDMQNAIAGFATMLGDVVGAVVAFVEVLSEGDIGGAFDALAEFDTIRAIFNGLGIDIYAVGQFVEAVAANVPMLGQAFSAAWGVISPALNELWTVINTEVVPAIHSLVGDTSVQLPTVQQVFEAVSAAIVVAAKGFADFLTNVVIPAIKFLVDWVVANWPTIHATINSVLTQVSNVIRVVLNGIQSFWDQWGDDILGIIRFVTNQIMTVYNMFSAAFSGDWRRFGELLRKYFDDAWAAIIAIISKAINWMLTQDWGKIGGDIIRGIANGITSATQFIIDAAKNAAKAAFEAAKGFLGIQSPSKLFESLGHNMMEGWANGITGGVGLPVGATMAATYATTVSVAAINVNGAQTPMMTAEAIRAIIEDMARDGRSRARMR